MSFAIDKMNSWLQDNNIEMYSTHNEGKSLLAERIIRILKTKIFNIKNCVN